MDSKFNLVKSENRKLTAMTFSSFCEAAAEMYKQFSSEPSIASLLQNESAEINTAAGSAFRDVAGKDGKDDTFTDWKIFEVKGSKFNLVKVENRQLTAVNFDSLSKAVAEMYKQFSSEPSIASLLQNESAEINTAGGSAFRDIAGKDGKDDTFTDWKVFEVK